MKFHPKRKKLEALFKKEIVFNVGTVEVVSSIKYLGYIITDDLSFTEDISRAKSKFYAEFNSILRHFSFANSTVKMLLFKQYCNQFYGAELWFGSGSCARAINELAVAFHKSIKKILNLSPHESNHFACQEAGILMFKHLLNKIKYLTVLRFFTKPCYFIEKNDRFLILSSVLLNEVSNTLKNCYGVHSLFDNDKDAILSRIEYVQNHELQMRQNW